jgi:hypothetical protein
MTGLWETAGAAARESAELVGIEVVIADLLVEIGTPDT